MKPVVIASLFVFFVGVLVSLAADGLPDRKSNDPQYFVMLDNAFGMQLGGDLKIAGVRAGKVTNVDLDKRTMKAKIGFRITQNGFGDLRRDVTCESRPQSLIGEYFLDCDPGTSPVRLKKGAIIPVTHTASTVPPDLVNDVLRRPERERLSLILDSFGTALAGNGRDLNDAIRRGVPALRETDRFLAILARQNTVVRDLNQHADVVLKELAVDRKDVGDWVIKARNAARDSADRRADIARGFHDLPVFLQELKPTMQKLGAAADAQTPALQLLSANAPQLKTFFTQLKPFSDASRPAFRALGQAGKTGSEAVPAAIPVVQNLDKFAKGTPELGKNLAITLEHLDDRKNTVEYDKRAAQQQGVPMPTGYSGLEGLLQYVLDQATSTNLFDGSVHILNVNAVDSQVCAPYYDAASVRGDAGKPIRDQCQVALGPSAPGVTDPDSTEKDAPPAVITYQSPTGPIPPAVSQKRADNLAGKPAVQAPTTVPAPQAQTDAPAKADEPVKKATEQAQQATGPLGLPDTSQVLPSTPQVPPPPPAATGAVGRGQSDPQAQGKVLDYLLG